MNKAIAIKDRSEHSSLEYHFGKAPCFAIIDDQNLVRIIENPHSRETAAKGVMVAGLLSDNQVKHVYAGEFGVKVKTALDVLGIRMHQIDTKGRKLHDFLNNL